MQVLHNGSNLRRWEPLHKPFYFWRAALWVKVCLGRFRMGSWGNLGEFKGSWYFLAGLEFKLRLSPSSWFPHLMSTSFYFIFLVPSFLASWSWLVLFLLPSRIIFLCCPTVLLCALSVFSLPPLPFSESSLLPGLLAICLPVPRPLLPTKVIYNDWQKVLAYYSE